VRNGMDAYANAYTGISYRRTQNALVTKFPTELLEGKGTSNEHF